MKIIMRLPYKTLAILCIAACSCVSKPPDRSLENILERKQLNVLVRYNSTDYFLYRGYPMGFQLELMSLFAAHLGVDLHLIPSNDKEEKFERIKDDSIDLIASNITVVDGSICFTHPLFQTRQVLVQRRRSLSDSDFINTLQDLSGKTIVVPKGSASERLLEDLKQRIDGGFTIVTTANTDQEELIAKVSSGEIPYTVADENVAAVCASAFFRNIDYSLPVSEEQGRAWGIACSADSLCVVVNSWIDSITKTRTFSRLYHKYFVHPRRGYLHPDNYSLEKGRLSPYDDIIKRYAPRLNWDWRLLAALIYQESLFQPDQVSWAGAIGLMQLMPAAAEQYDITLESSAEEQILAGVRHLQAFERQLPEEIVEPERTAFLLAAYNVGLGHILDARRLAVKYGKDPNVWMENVEVELLKKSDRTILRDTIVRHGYARGEETYRFVREILARWHHYQNLLP